MFATKIKILAVNAEEGLVKIRPTYPTIARRYALVLLGWGGFLLMLNGFLDSTTPKAKNENLAEVQHD